MPHGPPVFAPLPFASMTVPAGLGLWALGCAEAGGRGEADVGRSAVGDPAGEEGAAAGATEIGSGTARA